MSSKRLDLYAQASFQDYMLELIVMNDKITLEMIARLSGAKNISTCCGQCQPIRRAPFSTTVEDQKYKKWNPPIPINALGGFL